MIAKDFPSRRFSIGSRKSFTIMEGGQANAGTERNNVGYARFSRKAGFASAEYRTAVLGSQMAGIVGAL
jgi:hypothetical protein